ncbi:MAG: fluoride efflux transporter CrcB [Gemmatimonadales bacterium]
MLLIYVALGGAVGAVARYGLSGFVQHRMGSGFPWGTLAVNVAGSLLLGFIVRLFHGSTVTPELRAAVTIGLIGAFTTFSTFSYETVALLDHGEWSGAAAYLVGSVVLALAAAFVGMGLGSYILQARG